MMNDEFFPISHFTFPTSNFIVCSRTLMPVMLSCGVIPVHFSNKQIGVVTSQVLAPFLHPQVKRGLEREAIACGDAQRWEAV